MVLGWTKESWDDDWNIQDFPIEHKYWKELTDAERNAANHFGYTRITWDETDEVLFEDDGKAVRVYDISSVGISDHLGN